MPPLPRYRLLALDIDGTLVNHRNELSPANQAALRRAAAAGMRITLATGRRYSRTLPLVASLELDAPLVTGTGALIKHPRNHETLFCARFPPDILRGILSIVAAAGFEAVLYGDTFTQGFDFYCSRRDNHRPELAEYLQKNPGCERVWKDLMRRPPEDVFGGFVIGAREDMLALERTLHLQLDGRLVTHVLRSPFYSGWMCEIMPHNVTKWSGILRVAGTWGIAAEEIVAVGDDVNDVPMLRGAGLGVAMANAAKEVQQAADRIAPDVDEDGVATVVQWLLDNVL